MGGGAGQSMYSKTKFRLAKVVMGWAGGTGPSVVRWKTKKNCDKFRAGKWLSDR